MGQSTLIIQMIHYEGYLVREAYEMHTETSKIAEWPITRKAKPHEGVAKNLTLVRLGGIKELEWWNLLRIWHINIKL